jgi:hypothetical protein
MHPLFTEIVRAAVRHSKARNGVLWADALAGRIATATPLHVNKDELAEQLTLEAIRAGGAVVVARTASAPAKNA